MSKKKIVVVGGGNGSALTIEALKHDIDRYDISAVVAASDSGGSSGALRQAFNTLPAGDVMRAVLALSKYDFNTLYKIFYTNRFNSLEEINRKLKSTRGPNLGNLFLTLTAQYEGDFMHAIRALEEAVEAVGRAYLSTTEKTNLMAELENGQILKSEAEIDEPVCAYAPIKKVWLEPAGKLLEGAARVIQEANAIIFAPGSLYTSVIAAILPQGAREAIEKSAAELYYVSSCAYAVTGEYGPRSLSGTVNTLENYLPRQLNNVIYNTSIFTDKIKASYDAKKWARFQNDCELLSGRNLIATEYEKEEGGIDSAKLRPVLNSLLWK